MREVLSYVQYSPDELLGRLRAEVGRAVEEGKLRRAEGDLLIGFYRSGLNGYTYLEDGMAHRGDPEGESL